ncbi:MAG: CBS domain-containing protein [Pseudomonadales bacterium]|nr:CBS domain-containing protein [Pseudomonadales bacterium]
MMTIDEIMTRDPITLEKKSSLEEASELMKSRRIRQVPGVEQERKLVGWLTQRDLLAATAKDGKKLKVGDVMRTKVQSINQDTDLRSAALRMQKDKIGCLPVLRDDRVIGIITDSDYVGLAINLLEQLESMEPPEFDDDLYDLEDADGIYVDDDDDF